MVRRPDDPRLGEVTEFWRGGEPELRPGRPVLIGFPQDEGVRRNGGRVGAAEAPREIRRWLYRLVPWDCETDSDLAALGLLDVGDVRIESDLEASQAALGEVVGAVLRAGAVPLVLGGGHETAYGHYLGYVNAGVAVGVINIDAHLDVRPLIDGKGHSGSPFRQMMEHPTHPLPGHHYVCLGAQPQSVARLHLRYARERGAVVRWATDDLIGTRVEFHHACERLGVRWGRIYVTLDADVGQVSDVPAVSAPNVRGLPGDYLLRCARIAGGRPEVSSFDLVEINPRYDRDGQSARWGALVVWNFLAGLARRGGR
ncbi:MAG TPA: formimidoylglutamase [Gemmataceae bacterium]|nr:formimidoylglutamase [Gemmataceae bacterium]